MPINKYEPVLAYIDKYWNEATMPGRPGYLSNSRNLLMRIGQVKLPNPAVSPNHTYFAGTQFYWDTYFTVLGLIDAGRTSMAHGMVDNLRHLYGIFGLVPARNSHTSIGRTQPPFLTRMAYAVYEADGADDAWFDSVMHTAWREYETVWRSGQRIHTSSGLSRYCPRFLPGKLATYESGWDVSARFTPGKWNILPIDLNCLLFQYESDLEAWCHRRGNREGEQLWHDRKHARQQAINTWLWDDSEGFFHDYDPDLEERTALKTLAGYYALWCGVANKQQASRCRAQLEIFEHTYGLASSEEILWRHRQWDYPNGWPPLQLIVIEGLARYGFSQDAARLTNKWLDLNLKVFKRTGVLWEKYDVVYGDIGLPGRYPTQPGFAWTNSVFLYLLRRSPFNKPW